jgi:hypothetical protein
LPPKEVEESRTIRRQSGIFQFLLITSEWTRCRGVRKGARPDHKAGEIQASEAIPTHLNSSEFSAVGKHSHP